MKLQNENRNRLVRRAAGVLSLLALVLAAPGYPQQDDKTSAAPAESERKLDLSYMKGRQFALDGEFEKAAPLLEKALKQNPEDAYLNYQLSEVYLRLSNFERAEELARKAVEKDPKNQDYLANLAGIYASLKDYDKAKAQYRKILELDPKNRRAPLFLGILEAESGDLEAGVKTLGKAIEADEENYMAYFYRAKIHLENNDIESAQKDLDRCLNIRPDFVEAGTALGLLFERMGEVDKAIETYTRIQGTGRFKKRLAQLYLQRNEFDKALTELLDYEKVESDDYTARVKIALIYFELKRYNEAKQRFQAILKEQPSADVRFYLAAIHEEMKDLDKAYQEFRKVGEDSTFFRESMLHAGFILREQKKFKDGEKFAKELIGKYPRVPEFYDMLASFREQQKKYDAALEALAEGLSRFPQDEKLLYFQGALLDKVGKRDKAIENMKKIIAANDKNAHALNFLGYTYAEMGTNLDEAHKLISQALKLRPNDGYIEDSMGWVLFKRGELDEALERLEKAAELQPDEAVILEHLGDVYTAKKELAKATSAYERALAASRKANDSEHTKKLEQKLAELKSEKRLPSGKESAKAD